MKTTTSALLAALALAVTGCEGSSLLKDVKERTYWKQARKDQGYLGVVVAKEAPPDAAGARVVHVIKSSPAARMGLREGDFIREIYGDPFETPPAALVPPRGEARTTKSFEGGREVRPSGEDDARPAPLEAEAPALPPGRRVECGRDLEAALTQAGPQAKVTLVVARGSELVTLPVRLEDTQTAWGEQTRIALANAEDNKSSLSLPLIVSYERQRFDPDVYRDYFGVGVTEPVRRYLDVDVCPLAFFSLFRYESVPAADAWRLKILCWPFVWTKVGDRNASTDGISQPGQDSLIEL